MMKLQLINNINNIKNNVGLQLEVKGAISQALDLYQANGMLDEERRLQSIAPFLPQDSINNNNSSNNNDDAG